MSGERNVGRAGVIGLVLLVALVAVTLVVRPLLDEALRLSLESAER